MLIKFLICSTLVCYTVADVQALSRTYLPTSKQEAIVKFDIAQDALDVSNNEIVTNDLKQNNPESLTKKANNDPAYANFPHSYNGVPAVFPNQAYPGPVYPAPVFPPHHGLPPQGLPRPGFPPSPGFISPGYPQPGYPRPVYSQPGYPQPGYPRPIYSQPGYPQPGYPQPGYPQPGYPVQFYPGHGYPGHGFPGHGFYNPNYPVPGHPSYPVCFSNCEQFKEEKENEDDKLRVRVFNSGTQYDETNGGYLYKKPTVT